MFGIAPKSFNAVDMGASLGNTLAFINDHMHSTQIERGVGMPVVRVIQTAGRGVFGDQGLDLLSASRRDRKRNNLSVSLVNAENQDFPGCSPSTMSGAVAAKHGLVHLEGSPVLAEQRQSILVETDPQQLEKPLDGFLRSLDMEAKPIGRNAHTKVVDQSGFGLSVKSAHVPVRFGRHPS